MTFQIVEKPAFRIVGKQTWIGGAGNGQFGDFWQKCNEDGLLELLGKFCMQPGAVTNGMSIGVSRVEKDPSVRDFYFYVAMECPSGVPEGMACEGLEEFTVPAAKWAVFGNTGRMPDVLIEAEMYAFTEWLPASGFRHAAAPEMEVYPPCDPSGDALVEFWLPII